MYVAGGKVLLLKRCADSAHGGTWGFPAGKIEDGETAEQGALRESEEETAHRPEETLKLVADDDMFTLFECRGDAFVPVLNEEHDGYVWAAPDDLPQPLHPGVGDVIQSIAMDSARVPDINGWPEIRANPLSKVGVFAYSGRSIPGAPEADRAYSVYRPAEELADPECIQSFKLLPWIDNHVMLGHEDDGLMPAEKKGVQGVIGEEVYFEGDTLFGNLKVFSQSLANLIEAGKRELSCGYRCVYEWTSGVFNGQAYEVIQRRIRGNHLALVESGRMGPEVAVLDGSALDHFVFTLDSKEIAMAEEKKDGEAGGMSLEDAIKAIEGLMPAIKMLQDAAAGNAAEAAADPEPVAAVDKDPDDKPDPEKKDEPKVDPEKKDGAAMDAATTFKSFAAQFAARDKLAEQLSWHVGTFDHAEMSADDVAAYGVKKLGLTTPKGQEAAVLAGFLQGKGDPRKESRAQAAAMDSSSGDNFVNRHLNKGQ